MGRLKKILLIGGEGLWGQSVIELNGLSTINGYHFIYHAEMDEEANASCIVVCSKYVSKRQIKKIVYDNRHVPIVILKDSKEQLRSDNIFYIEEGVSIIDIISFLKILFIDGQNLLEDNLQLSTEERLILAGLCKGYSNKKLAKIYDIRLSRVKYYLQKLAAFFHHLSPI